MSIKVHKYKISISVKKKPNNCHLYNRQTDKESFGNNTQ